MAVWSQHGGGCCGIIHLHDFCVNGPRCETCKIPEKAKTWEEGLRLFIEKTVIKYYNIDSPTWNCLVEVVLTEEQIDSGWGPVLDKLGFKRVTEFYNSNSGNTCAVFYLQMEDLK